MVDAADVRMEIDWECTREQMSDQVEHVISSCRQAGKVIPLPLGGRGEIALSYLTMLLGQVNCDRCDGACCKDTEVNEGVIEVEPSEVQRLARYGVTSVRLESPCRFLKDGRCSIYAERPLVCLAFPFQPGGMAGTSDSDMATCMSVSARCPEGRRIARQVYMARWELRHQLLINGLIRED